MSLEEVREDRHGGFKGERESQGIWRKESDARAEGERDGVDGLEREKSEVGGSRTSGWIRDTVREERSTDDVKFSFFSGLRSFDGRSGGERKDHEDVN